MEVMPANVECCANCRFYTKAEQHGPRLVGRGEPGFCRSAPPTLVLSSGQVGSMFPVVAPDCWCGRFEVAPVNGRV